MANNASPSYENIFYIGGTGISGVTNLNMSYSVSRKPVNVLGGGHIQPILAEPLQGEVSFTRNYIYNDPLLDLTGDYGVDGSLIYASDLDDNNGQVIGFTSGYLSSYSINAQVGNVPQVECTFLVFGKLGSGVRNGELDYSGIHELQNLCFVNQKDIEISLEQSTTNRVTQFSQKYNITRTPIYDLREKTSENYYAPTEVITNNPVEVMTDFTVEVDDYYTANMMDNLRSGVYQGGLGVIIRCPNGGALQDHNDEFLLDNNSENIEDDGRGVAMYTSPVISGNLISESIDTSVDNLLTVNLQFRNFLQ